MARIMESPNNIPDAKDKADKLWGLANALTGFSVAQTIALILALVSSHEFVKHIQSLNCSTCSTAAMVGIGGGLFYGIPLIFCFVKEIQVRREFTSKENLNFYKNMYWWRGGALILFHAICSGVFWGFQNGPKI